MSPIGRPFVSSLLFNTQADYIDLLIDFCSTFSLQALSIHVSNGLNLLLLACPLIRWVIAISFENVTTTTKIDIACSLYFIFVSPFFQFYIYICITPLLICVYHSTFTSQLHFHIIVHIFVIDDIVHHYPIITHTTVRWFSQCKCLQSLNVTTFENNFFSFVHRVRKR